MTITHEKCRETATRPHLPLGGLATDLATEHGGTDANKRDAVRQGGRLNVLTCSYETKCIGEDGDRLAHNPEVVNDHAAT
jgi:hypothetical protein